MFQKIPWHKTNCQVVPAGVLKGNAGTTANLAAIAYEGCKNHCTSARWFSEFAFRFQQGRMMSSAFRLSSHVLSVLAIPGNRNSWCGPYVLCLSFVFRMALHHAFKNPDWLQQLIKNAQTATLAYNVCGLAKMGHCLLCLCPPTTNITKKQKRLNTSCCPIFASPLLCCVTSTLLYSIKFSLLQCYFFLNVKIVLES